MTKLIEIKRDAWSPSRRIAIIGIGDRDYIVDKTPVMIRRMELDRHKIELLMRLPHENFVRHVQAMLDVGRISGFKGVEEACRQCNDY